MNFKLPERPTKRNHSLRAEQSNLVRVASTHLPTLFGVFDLIGFERANMAKRERETALVMTHGNLRNRAPLLRIHSQCLTGESVFRESMPFSLDCQ
jgi:GTP cyclohydrolase II